HLPPRDCPHVLSSLLSPPPPPSPLFPYTTLFRSVLPTICWRPSRTLAEATWTAGAARRRRASLRGKDLTSRAVEPDLTLQRSQRSRAGPSPATGAEPPTSRSTAHAGAGDRDLESACRAGAGTCDLATARRASAGTCDLAATRRAGAGDRDLESACRAEAVTSRPHAAPAREGGDLATTRRAAAGSCDLAS